MENIEKTIDTNVEFNKIMVDSIPCSGIRMKMFSQVSSSHKIGEN